MSRIVVIGGGVAGCSAALAAARSGSSVALLSKLPDPSETNTRYAQGGIIYTAPDDSPELLAADILAAGGGDKAAAETLALEGPPLVRRLLIEELEVPFDRDEHGFEGFHLTREGAHSVPRILHHRDTTGREIQFALASAVREEGRIAVFPGMEATEISTTSEGRCAGVHAVKGGEAFTIAADSVVLATGGLGALYEHTTNPPGATGGGYALALRAGAEVRNLHYVQFHPTALYSPGGDRFLVSEAVRGEGGVLLDPDGKEFVDHMLGSLAPRDVVAREIWAMMERADSPCAFLDITHRSEKWLEERFPAIYARCLEEGIKMGDEPMPVVPAAHYSCGGVATNLRGETNVTGLFAAGEAANNGLHGHNRLASTSLLEGLVFGWKAGEKAAKAAPPGGKLSEPPPIPKAAPEIARSKLRRVMWGKAGLVRDAEGLSEGLSELDVLEAEFGSTDLGGSLLVARTVMENALEDGRSRGCHFRLDGYRSLSDVGGRVRVGR
ncbi:MAG: L-aspartate oxidase [Rubrobacteraceae bacterium]|nr:L-aspartate oxidase [Rubrobacter sp.]